MLYDPKWEVKTKTTWQSALLAAADIMEQRGQCTFTAEDANGRVCIYGALGKATSSREIYMLAGRQLKAHIGNPVAFNIQNPQSVVVAKMREIARAP